MSETTEIVITSNEQFIETQLEKFDVKKEELIVLADRFKELKVEDIDNRVQLAAVRSGRIELKNKRAEITKKGKSLRASAVAFQKAVLARESELIDLIEPTEKYLSDEEDRVLAERAEIEKRKEKEAADRIQRMMDQFSAIDYAVDYHDLIAMDDDAFQMILHRETILHGEIQKAKEEQRLAKLEEERLAEIARKEEVERLRLQREEQEKQAAELARQQAEFRAEQERVAEEQRKREKAIADEAAKIKATQEALEKSKREEIVRIEAERKSAEDHLNEVTSARFETLKSYGYTYPFDDLGTMSQYNYDQLEAAHRKAHEVKLHEEWLKAQQKKKEEEETKRIAEEQRLATIEADRVASLTDMQKIREFGNEIDYLIATLPIVTSKSASSLRDSIFSLLEQASQKCKPEIK